MDVQDYDRDYNKHQQAQKHSLFSFHLGLMSYVPTCSGVTREK